jgi:hypothetical protein
MRKFNLHPFWGGKCFKPSLSSFSGYTLAEIIVVMLIIAVVVAVSIGITKAKLDNVVSYTYYSAFSTLRKITTEMLADFDPKDEEYMVFNAEDKALSFKDLFKFSNFAPAANAKYIPNQGIEEFLCIDGIRPLYCWETDSYVCPPSKCPIKCPNGSISYTGKCSVTCWNGTVVSNAYSCPPKISCWDGSYATSQSKCPPKITCWNGSYVTNSANCPPYVTCWDGSKKGSYNDCPACTNVPTTIPCGQTWNSLTCRLEGSAKVCPAGQHLNNNCNCVNTCPEYPGCGKTCDNETGIISDITGFIRTCGDQTYEWSEEQCKCIPSPRTLPRKGENFVKLFEQHANIMSGTEVGKGSIIADNTTDFSSKTPDLVLRNGLRIYNMAKDAEKIDQLANNTQGGVYDGVPNTNEYGYTVYVDIDGAKGDSLLWSDVYPFYITLSGKVIPAYDLTANPDGSGGDSIRHLQVSAENETYVNGKRTIKWLAKSVSFKEGACVTGYVGDATPYCKDGTSYTKAAECTTNYNSTCTVKQIQPVKFFF